MEPQTQLFHLYGITYLLIRYDTPSNIQYFCYLVFAAIAAFRLASLDLPKPALLFRRKVVSTFQYHRKLYQCLREIETQSAVKSGWKICHAKAEQPRSIAVQTLPVCHADTQTLSVAEKGTQHSPPLTKSAKCPVKPLPKKKTPVDAEEEYEGAAYGFGRRNPAWRRAAEIQQDPDLEPYIRFREKLLLQRWSGVEPYLLSKEELYKLIDKVSTLEDPEPLKGLDAVTDEVQAVIRRHQRFRAIPIHEINHLITKLVRGQFTNAVTHLSNIIIAQNGRYRDTLTALGRSHVRQVQLLEEARQQIEDRANRDSLYQEIYLRILEDLNPQIDWIEQQINSRLAKLQEECMQTIRHLESVLEEERQSKISTDEVVTLEVDPSEDPFQEEPLLQRHSVHAEITPPNPPPELVQNLVQKEPECENADNLALPPPLEGHRPPPEPKQPTFNPSDEWDPLSAVAPYQQYDYTEENWEDIEENWNGPQFLPPDENWEEDAVTNLPPPQQLSHYRVIDEWYDKDDRHPNAEPTTATTPTTTTSTNSRTENSAQHTGRTSLRGERQVVKATVSCARDRRTAGEHDYNSHNNLNSNPLLQGHTSRDREEAPHTCREHSTYPTNQRITPFHPPASTRDTTDTHHINRRRRRTPAALKRRRDKFMQKIATKMSQRWTNAEDYDD